VPRTCTICTHADRPAIDQALVSGEPYRHIANRFGTPTASLQRHKKEHIPLSLRKVQDAEEIAQADSLLDQVRGLQARAMGILAKAEKAGDLRTALAAIGQARGVLELQAKLTGETDRGEEQPPPHPLHVLIQNMIGMPKIGPGVPTSLPPVLGGIDLRAKDVRNPDTTDPV